MNDKTKIYFDYQASTPLCNEAREAILRAEDKAFANPHSSEHALGWEASKIIDNGRETAARLINAIEDEIIFTSGATESNNLAIIGTALSSVQKKGRKKILVSSIEHKCIFGAAKFVEEFFNFEIVKIPADHNGIIDLEFIESNLNEDCLLASVMAVNNEIGTIQPINKIGEMCRDNGVIFHVDASQALYENIDVVASCIDLLSLSSHKLYGPKGIGLIYINNLLELKPTPILHGGGQQKGFRSGTVPVNLVAGFSAAVEFLEKNKDAERKKLIALRDYLISELQGKFKEITINGSLKDRHPGNINVRFGKIDAKALITNVQPRLAISTGSACTSGIPEPSHVLRAIGLNTEDSESSVRISVGRYSTLEEIDFAVELLANAAKKISA